MTFKKNQKGMTLVEVVVATAMFSVTFLGVTMCLSAALKLTNRNMMRDHELNVQQEIIEQHQVQGVQLRPTKNGITHAPEGDEIKFGNAGTFSLATGKGSVDNITEYQAVKTPDNGATYSGNTYNFEIKSFSSTPLGNTTTEFDRTAGKYALAVVNKSNYNVTVMIELKDGVIYEGSFANGYKSSSPIFSRTIPGKDAAAAGSSMPLPSELLVGYYNTGSIGSGFDGDSVKIHLIYEGNNIEVNVPPMNLMTVGGWRVTISDTGAVSKVHFVP